MLPSTAPVVFRTGREFFSTGLSIQRISSPIIAHLPRPVTRSCLVCFGAGNRSLSSRRLSTAQPTVQSKCLTFASTNTGVLSPHLKRVNCNRAFCTAVFSKPAVNVLEHTAVTEDALGIVDENDGDTDPDVKAQPGTDPWILRHKIVTLNTGKYPDRPQGVTFNVGYMDTGSDWHDSKKLATPTVLAIPGQPGSHDDMLPVVRSLYEEKGHRVVIVNMPGYDFTKGLTADDGEFYQNSSTDLAEFVYQFIQELQLERVDMVVTHSAGSIPLLIMVATSDTIKSAMIICTPSLHVPSRVCRPLWFIKGLVYTWNTPPGRKFMMWFLPRFNNVVQWLNTDDATQLITTAKFGAYSNFELMSNLAPEISAKNKPIVYVASKNDKLVELNLSHDWAAMLGISKDMFDVYDENYNMVKKADTDEKEYPKGVLLAKGGHYPQRKQVALPTLIQEARALMAYVVRKQE